MMYKKEQFISEKMLTDHFIYLFLRESGISSDCSASKIGWDYLQYRVTLVFGVNDHVPE